MVTTMPIMASPEKRVARPIRANSDRVLDQSAIFTRPERMNTLKAAIRIGKTRGIGPERWMARAGIIESERTALLALRRSRQIGDDVLQKLVCELDLAELALMRGTE